MKCLNCKHYETCNGDHIKYEDTGKYKCFEQYEEYNKLKQALSLTERKTQ